MASAGKTFRCQVVTPEKVVVDKPATFVALPAFDGELGVLAGRAPVIAKLGSGELRVESPEGDERLFVSGGFAQMNGETLTLLTEEAKAPAALDKAAAQAELASALARKPTDEIGFASKDRAMASARAKLHLAN
jgi:F-type H+-transporting ATPase subunit epsilon